MVRTVFEISLKAPSSSATRIVSVPPRGVSRGGSRSAFDAASSRSGR
jgi:hypothetical protein